MIEIISASFHANVTFNPTAPIPNANTKQDKGFFRAIFLDLFLRIFVRAFLNVDVILFYYLSKHVINDFQLKISSTYQNIVKFRSKCAKTKKNICPELQL